MRGASRAVLHGVTRLGSAGAATERIGLAVSAPTDRVGRVVPSHPDSPIVGPGP